MAKILIVSNEPELVAALQQAIGDDEHEIIVQSELAVPIGCEDPAAIIVDAYEPSSLSYLRLLMRTLPGVAYIVLADEAVGEIAREAARTRARLVSRDHAPALVPNALRQSLTEAGIG